MADRRISIRLAIEDADRVKAVLQSLGAEGAEMAAKIEAGTSRTGQSFEKLQRELDKTYAGQQRLAQAQEIANRAVKEGVTTQERANQVLELAQQRYLGAGRAMEGMAASAQRGFGGAGQLATQAGFQVQDFTVQVAGGQSALIAFAQQGSQLAGIFGPGGAIAGAALAIGAVTAHLVLGKSAADALNAAIDAQEKLYEDALKAAEDYSGGLAAQAREVQSLTDRYAALNREARDYEGRRVAAARDDLTKQQGTLGTTANAAVSGLLAQAQVQTSAAREAALRAGQPGSSAAIPLDVQEATRAIAEFRAQVAEAGGATAPILQMLATRLEDVAQRAGGLEAPADRARRALDAIIPDAQKLDQQLAANQRQLDALTGSTRTAAGALAQAGAAARAAIDPFAELQKAIGNANAGLEALRTGGLVALTRLTNQQQDEEAVTRRATQAREAYARSLSDTAGITREAAEAQAKARQQEFEDQARGAVAAERQLADERKRAEERERLAKQAGDRARREAETEAEKARKFRESLESGAADQTVFPLQAVQAALQRQTDRQGEAARKMAEESARAIEQEEQRRQQSFDRTVERYSADLAKGTADAIFDGAASGKSALDTLATTFSRAMRNAVAGALDVEIIRPLISSLFGGLGFTGSTGGAGSAGGGLGGLGSLLGLGGLGGQLRGALGLGDGGLLSGVGSSVTGFLGSPVFGGGALSGATNSALNALGGAYGPATPASLGIGGTTWGGLLGGAGLGFGAGALAGNLVQGIRGTTGPGGTIGAALGAGIGSIFGPLGALAGGVIGGAGGGLFGPTQKGLESRSGVAGIYTLDADGYLKIQNVGGKRGDTAGFTAGLQGQLDDINSQLRSRGLALGYGGGAAWSVGTGPAAAGLASSVNPNNFSSMIWAPGGGNVGQAVGALRGQGADYSSILSTVDWVNQVYEPLVASTTAADQFQTAIDKINESFAAVIDRAGQLGLATDALVLKRDEEVAAIEKQRQGTSSRATDAANGLFYDLAFGGSSALAPETQYFAAVSTLRRAAEGLGSGGQDALDRYTGLARSVLPVARGFLGTSERYGDLQAEVARTLRGAAPGADLALASLLEGTAGGTDRLIEVTASYGAQQVDVLTQIRGELQTLTAQVTGILARAAS